MDGWLRVKPALEIAFSNQKWKSDLQCLTFQLVCKLNAGEWLIRCNILFLFLDNFMLSATTAGDYTLFSPLQQESGPRLLHSFFGFQYMGRNAQVRVLVLKDNAYQVSDFWFRQTLGRMTSMRKSERSCSLEYR